MGHVYQRLTLSAVRKEEMTIMVDTGATYSLISPALADRLGVSRFPERYPVTLADGRQIDAIWSALASSGPASLVEVDDGRGVRVEIRVD